MTAPTKVEPHFQSAAENGLDLLLRAATQLKADPKLSIVAFAAGIEILLKARLLKEHWTLVVDDLERVDLDAYRAGSFRSITPEQAIARLRKVCGEQIHPDDEKALLAPSRHRNRVVHFFHPDLAAGATPQQQELIAIEQCRAWTLLHGLLTSPSWKPHLEALDPTIQRVHDAFQSVGAIFLQGKFQAIKGRLVAEAKGGVQLIKCATCHFESQALEPGESPLFTADCRVCGSMDSVLIGRCPACSCAIMLVNQSQGSCPRCAKVVSAEEAFATADLSGSSWTPCPDVACRECEAVGAVIRRDPDAPFCLSCFELLEGLEECDYCNQEWAVGYSGTLDEIGCPFCRRHTAYVHGEAWQ